MPELKTVFTEKAQVLKGYERRIFMARVVRALGKGGKRQAERELGWNRRTIRKGEHELTSGLRGVDAYALRGRQRAENSTQIYWTTSQLLSMTRVKPTLQDHPLVHAVECG